MKNQTDTNKLSPFDFVNDITGPKNYLMQTEKEEKEYVPFIVQRHFSYFPDTILYANALNKAFGPIEPDKKMHHDFFFHSVRSRKRFSKWHKKDKVSETQRAIMDRFQVNADRASEMEELMDASEKKALREQLGGS